MSPAIPKICSCQSAQVSRNGTRRGKQYYLCKDCGRQFVIAESAE